GGGLPGTHPRRGRVPRRGCRNGAGPMTATMTPGHSGTVSGDRDSFWRLVHAEWTKFRTVRGWVIAMVIAAALTAAVGLYAASGPQTGCQPVGPNGPLGPPVPCQPSNRVGPGGAAVSASDCVVDLA